MGVTKQIIKNINSINKKGLSSVFSANVINKIIAFLSNVVVVRVLTQKEFGYYSSANNIISFALLITGAGLLSGVLQYGAEQRPEEIKNQYYKYCLVGGICFDILLTAAVILYSACGLAPIKESTKYILLLRYVRAKCWSRYLN